MEAGPRERDQEARERNDAPRLSPDGPDHTLDGPLGVTLDVDGEVPVDHDVPVDDAETGVVVAPEVEVDIRPQRRLRIWQLAPIVGLAAVGSLMFAFPLAFGSGDGGAVVAMLGVLISGCAAGWGLMAARRVGHTWPGLPERGCGERPDWRVLALYVIVAAALVALAVWRVARLR
ncbi:hypothetical protein [Streptomyces formicae]|uniref:Transmembrane protein n=1 Tax=Streptomyces formicae TaxID=1616117 RepID=A0ABY3WUS6_9ACTN|nr:hypothetical protein [Streptomyces formicae]UNM16412.1 hypothetical protein J4032_09090 [Streptomyces formicae]